MTTAAVLTSCVDCRVGFEVMTSSGAFSIQIYGAQIALQLRENELQLHELTWICVK